MAYATQADMELRLSATVLSSLAAPATAADVATATIAASDAEIDMWETAGWTTAQKLACSVALAIERVYQRGGATTPAPTDVRNEAARWRALLQLQEDTWTCVTYDPTMDETSEQLSILLEGRA